jgi:hypothetical protein
VVHLSHGDQYLIASLGEYKMSSANIVSTVNTDNLDTARRAFVESFEREYGARREYAVALNSYFDFPWFMIEHKDNTEIGKLVKLEKAKLFEGLNTAKHSNPSQAWKKVREYGEQEARKAGMFGLSVPNPEDNVVECEEGESGKANHTRSPMLRNVEDLTALWKFNHRQTALDARVQRAQTHIQQALKELGVDVATVS